MKTRIAVIFGGKSAEHEVSARSASNIYNAVDRNRFDVLLLGISKTGEWRFNAAYQSTGKIQLNANEYFKRALPVRIDNQSGRAAILSKQTNQVAGTFDMAFPIIHGTFGEDGTLQGILKSLNIPFVGPDVLGSAVCMDKDVTKRLLRDSGIPIADFITLHKHERSSVSFAEAESKLGLPMFVKPCNAGSSVGVSKVTDEKTFRAALNTAFAFDNKILIEEAVIGKEVECGVLGNEELRVSVVGEIIPNKDFYSYDAKYIDADGATLKVPADIEKEIAEDIRQTALKAFTATCCEGMARVDFFLRPDNTFVLNELNTLPGFTSISMYPKVFEMSRISYSGLITRLVELALERYERDSKLKTVI